MLFMSAHEEIEEEKAEEREPDHAAPQSAGVGVGRRVGMTFGQRGGALPPGVENEGGATTTEAAAAPAPRRGSLGLGIGLGLGLGLDIDFGGPSPLPSRSSSGPSLHDVALAAASLPMPPAQLLGADAAPLAPGLEGAAPGPAAAPRARVEPLPQPLPSTIEGLQALPRDALERHARRLHAGGRGESIEGMDKDGLAALVSLKGNFGARGKAEAVASMRRWMRNVDAVLREVGAVSEGGPSMTDVLNSRFATLQHKRRRALSTINEAAGEGAAPANIKRRRSVTNESRSAFEGLNLSSRTNLSSGTPAMRPPVPGVPGVSGVPVRGAQTTTTTATTQSKLPPRMPEQPPLLLGHQRHEGAPRQERLQGREHEQPQEQQSQSELAQVSVENQVEGEQGEQGEQLTTSLLRTPNTFYSSLSTELPFLKFI